MSVSINQSDKILSQLRVSSELTNWEGLADGDKIVYLNRALMRLNSLKFTDSYKLDDDQKNSFPRISINGYTSENELTDETEDKGGFYDYEIAQALLAWYYSDGFTNESSKEQTVKSESVGKLSVTYTDVSDEDIMADMYKLPMEVYQYLAKWLNG